jgi:hypothetical protein
MLVLPKYYTEPRNPFEGARALNVRSYKSAGIGPGSFPSDVTFNSKDRLLFRGLHRYSAKWRLYLVSAGYNINPLAYFDGLLNLPWIKCEIVCFGQEIS